MKVLVVDDASIIPRLIKNTLAQSVYSDVLEATNGREAVNTAKKEKLDLILMDWNMPEVTGLEAVQSIRASGNTAPIVMVTTEAEKQRVVTAVQAGINDYLVRPFTPDALIDRVKKFTEE